MRVARIRLGRRVNPEAQRPSMLAVAYCPAAVDDRYAELGVLPPGSSTRSARALAS